MLVQGSSRGRRGSALVIVVVIAAVAFMIAFTVVGQAEVARKYAGTTNTQSAVRYAAESGLAYVGDMITYPSYANVFPGLPSPPTPGTQPPYAGTSIPGYDDSNRNLFLHNRLDGAGTHMWIPFFTSPNPTLWVRGYSVQAAGPGGSPSSSTGRPQFVNDIPVWVWLEDNGLAGDDYRLASYAEYGPNVHLLGNGQASTVGAGTTDRVLVIQELRENQPFSSWMMAALADNVTLGPGLIDGNVRSNKAIITPHPPAGGPTITGTAEAQTGAANGFKYFGDTTQTNDFNGTALQGSSLTSLPIAPPGSPTSMVAAQQGIAASAGVPPAAGSGLNTGVPTGYTNAITGLTSNDPNFFNVRGGATGASAWAGLTGPTVNATITIDNTVPGKPTMTISAQGSVGGPTKVVGKVPFPSTGSAVIYVDGNVTVKSVDGTFSGKLTIASGGTLSIDTNLIYKDNGAASGSQYAYAMKDNMGNDLGDPQALTGGNWYGSGNTYTPNPSFNPSNGAALGLMAHDNINTTVNAPANFLLNASTFSATGSSFDGAHTGPDVNPGTATVAPTPGPPAPARSNWAMAGSLVGNLAAAGHAGPIGFGNGGLVGFDTNAAKTPPPAWVRIRAPAFGATYTRSSALAPAIYARATSGPFGPGSGPGVPALGD